MLEPRSWLYNRLHRTLTTPNADHGHMDTIVLITDFGNGSPYVAEMKGAILSVNPQVRIVDGTHVVPPQDVAFGAMVVRQLATVFPPATVFVCVVDPGVGTPRNLLLANCQGRSFIAPDNGLLSFIVDDAVEVAVLDKPEFWNRSVSATFHGRDIMGPAAAHLTLGVPHGEMASLAHQDIVRLRWPVPQWDDNSVHGEVVFIDSFGNLISNIPAADVVEGQGIVEFQGGADSCSVHLWRS